MTTAQVAPQSETQQKTKFSKIGIVLNPVSGIKQDKEAIICGVFEEYDVPYEIYETQAGGEGEQFAKDALKEGCDLVLACGGDGTVKEVAAALRDTDTPMGILPGGTGNVMAVELEIPLDIEKALRIYLDGNYKFRKVDMGMLDNQTFLLRCGMGYEAEVSVGAPQKEKARWGRLSYFMTAWRQLRRLRPNQYRVIADGEVTTVRGITGFICNSTNIGLPQLKLAADTHIDDGLLDVVLINSIALPSILRVTWGIVTSVLPYRRNAPKTPNHWQAKEFTIETRHRQLIAVDGEVYKRTKRVTVRVLPQAITVAVPKTDEDES